MAKSTTRTHARKSRLAKPEKPRPDYPLTPHDSGWWVKKIKGKFRYFGKWRHRVDGKWKRLPNDGADAAEALYLQQATALHAGLEPGPQIEVGKGGVRLADLCNHFLTSKLNKLDRGRITSRTFAELKAATDRLIAFFGNDRDGNSFKPADFTSLLNSFPTTWGPHRIAGEVQRVKSVFKHADVNGIIEAPVRFGSEFKKPEKNEFRQAKAKAAPKLFTPAEILAMVKYGTPPLKAMVLLAVNAGLGNMDCACLTLDALDLPKGWLTFPRPKTGVVRRAKLWKETVQALKAAIESRPEPKSADDARLVFVTRWGEPWVRTRVTGEGKDAMRVRIDSVQLETGKLIRKLATPDEETGKPAKMPGINRKGVGFYALRHVFRTVADATRDFPAVRLVMGHSSDTMDDAYRETIDDSRLEAVADHVHDWLWPKPVKAAKKKPSKAAK